MNASGAPADERGLPRPIDLAVPNANGSDGSDIGALEVQLPVVTNNNDSGVGSLRLAVNDTGHIAGGLLVQHLPEGEEGRDRLHTRLDAPDWEHVRALAETIKAYHRRDLDKSTWEDKHVFRPDEMIVWGRDAGLTTHFLPNTTFEHYAHTSSPPVGTIDFEKFVREYLQYCMGYGAASADQITKSVQPLCRYVMEACSGMQEPYLLGTFVMQRPREEMA